MASKPEEWPGEDDFFVSGFTGSDGTFHGKTRLGTTVHLPKRLICINAARGNPQPTCHCDGCRPCP